jgi:hypothetical protein
MAANPGDVRQAVLKELARRELERRNIASKTPDQNPDLALLDRQMSGTQPGIPASKMPTNLTIPGLNADISLSGAPKTAFDAASGYLDRTMTPAVVGATVGSMAFPPAGAAAGLGMLARFAPGVLGAAAGGGIGGGAEEAHRPGSTTESILAQGAKSAAQMGAAEIAGLGVGAVADKLLAPGLPLDPLAKARPKVAEFLSTIGGKAREAATAAREAMPQVAQDALDSAIASAPAQAVAAGAKRVGAFADTIAGNMAVNNLLIPAALDATFGLGIGTAAAVGRNLLDPGGIARYLANKELPSMAVRTLGRQTASIPLRSFFDDSNEKKDEQP